MRGKWLLLAGSAVLIAAAAGAILYWRGSRALQPQARTQPAAPQFPAGEIVLAGRLQAQEVTPVEAEVSGKIDQLLVEVGEEVYEGQLLARISNLGLETARETAQAAVDTAEARINQIEAAILSARLEASRARADATRARGEFERTDKLQRRQKMLFSEGATPRLVYERSEKEAAAARTEFESLDVLARQAEERAAQLVKDLDAAKRLLDDRSKQLDGVNAEVRSAELHAPVTGTVVSRNGEPGGDVEAGRESAKLFGIAADLSALEVVVEPEPPVLRQLKLGMPALVILADVPEPVEGKVKRVTESEAVVEFTSPNPIVKPGMTAQVRLKLS